MLGDGCRDWDWFVDWSVREVVLVTAWGDLFITDTDRENVWFLSTNNGTIEDLEFPPSELRAALQTPIAKEVLLMAESAALCQIDMAGVGVGPLKLGNVLSLSIPAVLGGEMLPDNIDSVQLATHLSFQGQLQRQVKDIPEGSVIKEVEIDPETNEVKLIIE